MTNMLNVAGEAVRQAGFAKVDTRVMDAENIDLDADSLGTAMRQNVLGGGPDGPFTLKANSWAVRGIVPNGQ